jgi:predicted HTH transcriptional regulator
MTEEDLLKIIDNLKITDEIPYVEAKSNLSDIHKIGKTISAISNSASWKYQEYGYFIWGLKDKTWDIIGTEFKLEKIKVGNLDGNMWLKEKGFDYSCDFQEFEFVLDNKRIGTRLVSKH